MPKKVIKICIFREIFIEVVQRSENIVYQERGYDIRSKRRLWMENVV